MIFWIYFLKVTICWVGFTALYYLLFRKETFFSINRWYLIATLLAGLVIPLIPIGFLFNGTPESVQPIVWPIQQSVITLEASLDASQASSTFRWSTVLWIVYLTGVAVAMGRFLWGLKAIWRKFMSGHKQKCQGYTLIWTDEIHLPFSFFGYVFWSHAFKPSTAEEESIMSHELSHVRGWHSMDVLLIELASIAFWCNPCIYWYRRTLRLVHEYIADAFVVKNTHAGHYSRTLLKQSQSGFQTILVNHFFHSQLKNRLKMMLKDRSKRSHLLKYGLVLPLITLFALAFAIRQEDKPAPRKSNGVRLKRQIQFPLLWKKRQLYRGL